MSTFFYFFFGCIEEIEKSAHLYLEHFNQVSLMHSSRINKKAKVVESFIAPVDYDINDELVKKGSWVMATHILDKKLWKSVQSKELNAYSIEGVGSRGPDLVKFIKDEDGKMEKVSKGQLMNMIIDAVALVDKGANKKKFYLTKNYQGDTMDKDLAIELVKSIENKDLRTRVLKSVDEDEQAEVKAAIEALEAEDTKVEKSISKEDIEKIVAAISAKFKPAGKDDEEDPKKKKKEVKKEDNEDEEDKDAVIQKYIDDETLDIPDEYIAAVLEKIELKKD